MQGTTSFLFDKKQFGNTVAVYAKETKEGERFLIWQKVMYILMAAFFVIGAIIPLSVGITDISIVLILVLTVGVCGSIIPFALSTFFGHAVIHRTSYFLSSVTDPFFIMSQDKLEFIFTDMRRVDRYPNHSSIYSMKYLDMQYVDINKETNMATIRGKYSFNAYRNSNRKVELPTEGFDLYTQKGGIVFVNTLVNPDVFFEELRRAGVPVSFS